MDQVQIFKALGNETRLNILMWLKEPAQNFEPQLHANVMQDFPGGVCLRSIKDRAQLSQSTISKFMAILEEANLVESCRIDQYTYFRVNNKTLTAIACWLNNLFSE